jgi:hypothetical protein
MLFFALIASLAAAKKCLHHTAKYGSLHLIGNYCLVDNKIISATIRYHQQKRPIEEDIGRCKQPSGARPETRIGKQ